MISLHGSKLCYKFSLHDSKKVVNFKKSGLSGSKMSSMLLSVSPIIETDKKCRSIAIRQFNGNIGLLLVFRSKQRKKLLCFLYVFFQFLKAMIDFKLLQYFQILQLTFWAYLAFKCYQELRL